jgi:hypothetical protein
MSEDRHWVGDHEAGTTVFPAWAISDGMSSALVTPGREAFIMAL